MKTQDLSAWPFVVIFCILILFFFDGWADAKINRAFDSMDKQSRISSIVDQMCKKINGSGAGWFTDGENKVEITCK